MAHLLPGSVRARPQRKRSQAHPGVEPLSPYTTQTFQPLPRPLGQPPYRYNLNETIPQIDQTAANAGKLVFHAVGGSIDSIQQQWLTNEVSEAPKDKALIVALHHPIYSFDNYHSGSPRMADAVQQAINDSRRREERLPKGRSECVEQS